MSEFINNATQRKEQLKHLLLELHNGGNPALLRRHLISALKNIPYNEVVEVEQELINSNTLSEKEILDFCDCIRRYSTGASICEERRRFLRDTL